MTPALEELVARLREDAELWGALMSDGGYVGHAVAKRLGNVASEAAAALSTLTAALATARRERDEAREKYDGVIRAMEDNVAFLAGRRPEQPCPCGHAPCRKGTAGWSCGYPDSAALSRGGDPT